MFVHNFFTKATAEPTGCFAFFKGSTLGVEAYFRGGFAGNDFFLDIDEGLFSKPFIRVKLFPAAWGLFIREVEIYNPDLRLYEPLSLTDKDRAFLLHVIETCSTVLNKAAIAWRGKVEKIEDPEFEEIPL